MRKIFALSALLLLLCSTSAWAQGTWQPKGFGYAPYRTAEGTDNNAATALSQARIDSRLGKDMYVGDPILGNTLQTAVAYLTANTITCKLHITAPQTLTTNLTVPSYVTLAPDPGAILTIPTGVTLTINGPFQAGLYHVFSLTGTGIADLSSSPTSEVHAEWWDSGSGDFSLAIQAAIQSRPSANGITVHISGLHYCITQINVTRPYCYFVGDGYYSTQLVFVPIIANQIMFNFQATSGVLFNNGIRKMALFGYQTTYTMTAIRSYACSELYIEDMGVDNWTGNNNSIGIQVMGQEEVHIENMRQIHADRPIVISRNPLYWGGNEDFDHSFIRNCNINCMQATGKNIEIETGVALSNSNIDGDNSLENGMYGIYWDDTTSIAQSYNLTIEKFRYEQPQTSGGYGIYLVANSGLVNLSIEDCVIGGASGIENKGIYLRNCYGTIKNLADAAGADPLNVDTGNLTLIDCNIYYAAINTNSLIPILNIGNQQEASPQTYYQLATFGMTGISLTPQGATLVYTIPDGVSISVNADYYNSFYQSNTQSSGTLTVNNFSGTPTAFQSVQGIISSTNSQTFAWGNAFVGTSDFPLPASIGAGKEIGFVFKYDPIQSKWAMVALTNIQ